MTLYELTDDMRSLLAMLEDLPDEEPEARERQEQAIKDTLSMLALDFKEKAEGYGMVIRQMQADAEALKSEKLRIAKKQSSLETNIDRLRGAMLYAMLLTGQTKVKTPLFSFSTQTRWKAYLDVDPAEVPEEFRKQQEIKIDMPAVEKWLKADGCKNVGDCQWAHLDQVESLIMR